MMQPEFWEVLATLLTTISADMKWSTQFPCPEHTYSLQAGSGWLQDYAPCTPEAFCPSGPPKPVPCPWGTYNHTPKAEQEVGCALCSAGHQCPKPGIIKPQPCNTGSFSGTFREAPGAARVEDCQLCLPGAFCGKAGLAKPQGLCHPGHYCGPGSSTATPTKRPSQKGPVMLVTAAPKPNPVPGRAKARPRADHLALQARNTGHKVLQTQYWGLCCPGEGSVQVDPSRKPRMFLSKASECLSCPPGHFCAASGLITPSGLCAPGYFCLVGASSPTPTGLSERGGPCPRGHFCPWGTSLPQPCLSGSYSTLPGQASCFTCPAGYYCPENMTDYREHPCPAGFYCPPGTKYATQFPCPRGYYNPDSLTHSLDSCLPCPPGHYCGQENLTKASGPCDAGWFCVLAAWTARPFDLDNYTSTNCLCPATATGGKCPAGSYCPMGSPEPTPCPPGSFCATSGLSIPSGPCQAGYFCAGGSMSPAPEDDITGAPCPPGSFCSYYCDPSARPIQDFSLYPCPQGYYCPLGTAKATQHSCPVGTYGSQKGLTNITECQPCPAGKFCAQPGLTAPTGFYCPKGTGLDWQPCPPGTYGPELGLSTLQGCQVCGGGRFCPVANATEASGQCWEGFFCTRGSTRPNPEPSTEEEAGPCPRGYYCPRGSAVSQPCPPGTFNPWLKLNSECRPRSDPPSQTPPSPLFLTIRVGQVWGKCPAGYFCPPGTSEVMAPGSRKSQTLCPQGQLCMEQCPPGFYCPEGSGEPILCPPYTLTATPGAQQKEDCGPCPPGHWCRAEPKRLCVGKKHTYLAEEGGQSLAECLPCPSGYHCPWPGLSSFKDHPCPPGHWCPGTHGALPCPPGTFQTEPGASAPEDCELCPPGYYCPDSELRGQANVFPIPCQAGFECPAGAVTEVPCRAGSYCGPQTGVPPLCPEGFACPAGSSSYPDPGQRVQLAPTIARHWMHYPANPVLLDSAAARVSQRCPPGDIRLAATHKCVSPQMHDCDSFCRPGSGELSADLGICQCRAYVSAEELCDTQCLATAPQLSLAWSSSKKLILSIKKKAGNIIQREVSSTLGPDQPFPGSARVYLIEFGPHGIFGFIISSVDMVGSFLQGTPAPSTQPQRLYPTTGPRHPYISPHIPNPVVCLAAGDVILFQLHILPHNRSASHYPVYQRQHLLNSNPHWDFGAFRRLCHLVQETQFNLSRFAHRFLDPGTYVFRDNGQSESIAVVHVQEEGAVCSPGLAPIQPSSPYQLGRLGILRRELLLAPDWAAITGINLDRAARTEGLEGLCVAVPQVCPMRVWRPQWRSLRWPHLLTEHAHLEDSFLFCEDLGHRGSGEGTEPRKKAMTWGTGEPPQAQTLENFSVRTLYDKLEDQSLHVAAQLSRHQRDASAFYKAAGQQLQGLQDLLQVLSMTEMSALGRDGRETEARDTTGTETGRSEMSRGSDIAASPEEHWPRAVGCTPSVSSLGFQPELDRAIAALASVLSQAYGPLAGISRKVEDDLDKLNEEFFQLTTQALELQKVDKPDQLPPGEANTFVVASSILPGVWWDDRADPMEAGQPSRKKTGHWALERKQALALEVQRVHVAQKIEDLEWELSLLLQVAEGGLRAERSQPSCGAVLEGSESH
ncbi:hypothetical protein H920_09422 [Fukomys damarensis]|uniref:Uncharacterized protein n=1 Tax=Fukomys damarensis TaxID=885580 RepID=A0A091DDP9_FUKDA|nr:hypothetical protein H920_09422 [Fukomys damarensis]